MIEYATALDVENAYGGLPPDNAEALRVAAHALIARATRGAVYSVDGDWRATDPAVITAFQTAVVEQVKFWSSSGVDPTIPTPTSAPRVVKSTNLGGGSLTYADAETRAAERAQLGQTLAPLAVAALESASLTVRGVVVYG